MIFRAFEVDSIEKKRYPHPDARGKTGNGVFADILAQTDTYIGELLNTIEELVSLSSQISIPRSTTY